MNYVEAVKSGFDNFHNFTGRASRSEYWFWALFTFSINLILSLAEPTIFGATKTPLSTFFSIFTFIPGIAVGARRLHDIGKTGWLQLLWIIPIVGWIILIVWFCTKGPAGDNRFGPDPLATA